MVVPIQIPDVYADPFRDAKITPQRVDMGVDYAGSGPIYALGPGRIIEADTAWASSPDAGKPGTFIVEHITQGPLTGKDVYMAEGLTDKVHVGEKVTSSTVLGDFTDSNAIETGYASGVAGQTMAAKYNQFTGANSTAFGEAYNKVLGSTGAPEGILQNKPPTGTLPKNWPDVSSSGGVTTYSGVISSAAGDAASGVLSDLFGGLLTGSDWKNGLERLGLIVLGGVLVIVGVWILAGKKTLEVTADMAKVAAL